MVQQIASSLAAALDMASQTSDGSRHVFVTLNSDQLVPLNKSRGLRTGSWQHDFANLKSLLDDSVPCFVVYYVPSSHARSASVDSSRKVFLGHGHRAGGLSSLMASKTGAELEKNKVSAKNPQGRILLVSHLPSSMDSTLRAKYIDAKAALLDYLGNKVEERSNFVVNNVHSENRPVNAFQPDQKTFPGAYTTSQHKLASKLSSSDGPLLPWEKQLVEDDSIPAQKPTKIGGFLADLNKAQANSPRRSPETTY